MDLKGASIQNAGENLSKYTMAQLRQKTIISLAQPENDYLRATFEAWLKEDSQEGNLQFFYEVQKFKELGSYSFVNHQFFFSSNFYH